MRRKGITAVLLAVGIMASLTGCGAAKIEYEDAAAAQKALNTAQTVSLKGELNQVNQQTNILADDKVAAYVVESGFWNTKWTISVDGETWFCMKEMDDDDVNDVEGVKPGSTYGFYDSEDNCIGYSQVQYMDDSDDEDDYYLIFMDEEGILKDYFALADGTAVYDWDGNLIATGSGEKKNMFSDKCNFEIKMEKDSKVQIDFTDKFAIYEKLFANLRERYSN